MIQKTGRYILIFRSIWDGDYGTNRFFSKGGNL